MNHNTLLIIFLCYYTWYVFIIVLLSIVIVFLSIKYLIPNFKRKKKSLTIFFLSLIFLSLLIDSLLMYSYVLEQKEYNLWLTTFKNKATEEMNNDMIDFEYFGLFNSIKTGHYSRVDSISLKYGVKLIPISDVNYGVPGEKAKEKYNKIINSYLDKRNGFGWKERMNKELEPYVDRRKRP